MARFDARAALPEGKPGPWATWSRSATTPATCCCTRSGIGIEDLRFTFEGHPGFAVFPTFPIRWGSAGVRIGPEPDPLLPEPLTIDAERMLEQLRPLLLTGTVGVRTRLVAVNPRRQGQCLPSRSRARCSMPDGQVCVRMISGSMRRRVEKLGDIEPSKAAGRATRSSSRCPPARPTSRCPRRSGPTRRWSIGCRATTTRWTSHPEAARFGGFEAPILHGLCTLGHARRCSWVRPAAGDPARFVRLKLRFASPVYPGDRLDVVGWHEGSGKVIFNARVGEKGRGLQCVLRVQGPR
jgi:hypothetical protein